MSNIDSTVVITAETGFSGNQLKNFYYTNAFQGFTWMLFHFSVVFFFTKLLDNLALVGIFLWLANFTAFLLDIPLGILQRYISTKKFFIMAAFSQLVAIGIFFVMIFNAFSVVDGVGNLGKSLAEGIGAGGKVTDTIFSVFSANIFNWIGLLVAAVCYGLTKELNDVSTFGYILSNSKPDQYGVILSRSNITFGIGSLFGLAISGFLLNQIPSSLSLIILGIIISGFMAFTIKFFDNTVESIGVEDIKEFTVSVKKLGEGNIKENLSQTISAVDLGKIVQSTKYLFLKPKQQNTGKKIPWKDVMASTLREFKIILEIISHNPIYYALIWGMVLVLIFGFWDTFASSFLIDFLDNIAPGWWYILLAVVGIPGIVLQEFAIKLAQKLGNKTIGIAGLALSGSSLIFMGILASSSSPSSIAILSVALINSLWYACGMAIGQNAFLETYNKIYAEHENLKEMDANASAGPMKVLQNLANVIGLVLGGVLVAMWFNIFFFIFAIIILGTLGWTFMNKSKVDL